MSNVVFTDASGVERTATAQAGDSVMQTAKRNGIPGITAECGGALSCATCPVSYTHLTLPTILRSCRSRWSPYH